MKHAEILLTGIVQGVGFRPFVKRTALHHGIKGYVENREFGVKIVAQASKKSIEEFVKDVLNNAPAVSTILTHSIKYLESELPDFKTFEIAPSKKKGEISALIPPDIATCDKCAQEIIDKDDRHFSYPFTNCTNCGPRFSIIRSIPYDRKNTTMKKFIMCDDCNREYTTVADRRYHAQPNACPKCGPELQLIEVVDENPVVTERRERAFDKTVSFLQQGEIVAIKGIGGYHLVCNALNKEVIEKLRKLKYRPQKPFALMARDIDIIKEYCAINDSEKEMLEGQQKPIVLLGKKKYALENVAPGVKDLGFMLPYTPLQYLLFKHFRLLVFTSGNISEEALENKDDSAFRNLSRITQYYLSYNREIFNRIDDSIVTYAGDQRILIRKARGFVPKPINIKKGIDKPQIFAAGADMKGSFGLTKENIFLGSQYLGDLVFNSNTEFYRESLSYFQSIFEMKPEVVIADSHPNYFSTQFAKEFAEEKELPVHYIQHHKAHIYSVMAENDLENVLGVSFDGTGYGDDGNIWGGEFFIIKSIDCERFAHLNYLPMVSGERAAKEPWRMALIYLFKYFPDAIDTIIPTATFPQRDMILHQLLNDSVQLQTSSMGRFFDAVASLIDVCHYNSYEGEAAMKLEAFADENFSEYYNINFDKQQSLIEVALIIRGIVNDILDDRSKKYISSKFHFTIARMVFDLCKKMKKESGIDSVALSGGVFQNVVLVNMIKRVFYGSDFKLFWNEKVPPNDAGIALGQVYSFLLKSR
ncbi:MAG: carbamoyltransferase HypF [Candidatus Cloacimonetes bacterium]|nr:carbamoyltransferase HypF [Candidatus Cloacimonadota bacterium]